MVGTKLKDISLLARHIQDIFLYKSGHLEESAIVIPFYIHGCHWVATVRREIHGRVLFLYCDDLNDSCNKTLVKSQLQQTSKEFYPKDAVWINFNSNTYQLHYNEWGP
jgi:hypothetical protein